MTQQTPLQEKIETASDVIGSFNIADNFILNLIYYFSDLSLLILVWFALIPILFYALKFVSLNKIITTKDEKFVIKKYDNTENVPSYYKPNKKYAVLDITVLLTPVISGLLGLPYFCESFRGSLCSEVQIKQYFSALGLSLSFSLFWVVLRTVSINLINIKK